MDFVEAVREMNAIGGTREKYDSRKMALYVSLCMEETSEMIDAFENGQKSNSLTKWAQSLLLRVVNSSLKYVAKKIKAGHYDNLSAGANIVEVVDAGADLATVGLGTIIAAGYDVIGVTNEVSMSNLSKFPIDAYGKRYAIKDIDGKWVKGPDYFRPSLEKFKRDSQ